MVHIRDIPEGLLFGRRAIDGLEGIDVLEDWFWNDNRNSWVLKCAITIESSDLYIPKRTVWYIVADSSYPEGEIVFYPAKNDGIKTTFQHQSHNSEGPPELPWRKGDICLHSVFHHVGQFEITDEPLSDPNRRLKWRFERVQAWLLAAAQNELVKPGDTYELPHVPLSPVSNKTVLFNENKESFSQWKRSAYDIGYVELIELRQQPQAILPISFESLAGQKVFSPSWGKYLTEKEHRSFKGLWLLLKETPVLPVWHMPKTWGELKAVFHNQKIDLNEFLKPIKKQLKRNTILFLIGFPIMERIADPPCQINWLAIELPSAATQKKKKGIKKNFLKQYSSLLLSGDDDITWLNTENCHYSQVSVRGKFNEDVIKNAVLLIGLGAIGSLIGEQLARGGFLKLALMDQDIVAAGNLVRHTLGLESVTKRKSKALYDRLVLVSPHIDVDVVDENFPPNKKKNSENIQKYPIVVDCTANRNVRHELGNFNWTQDKLFITIALGYKAKRLYLFSAIGSSFPDQTFDNMIKGWLELERPEYIDDGFPREGIGCWHPVFPARVDDIWMLSSAAIKELEQTILDPPKTPQLVIFEQAYKNGDFVGIKKEISNV